ncbi:MAG: hypothetical protein AAGE89_04745 [Pseudomonadota bacterium]
MDIFALLFIVPPLIAVVAARDIKHGVMRQFLRFGGLYFLTVFTLAPIVSAFYPSAFVDYPNPSLITQSPRHFFSAVYILNGLAYIGIWVFFGVSQIMLLVWDAIRR